MRTKWLGTSVVVCSLLVWLAMVPAAATEARDSWIITVGDGVDPVAVAAAVDAVTAHTYRHVMSGFAAELNDDQVRALRRDPRVSGVERDRPATKAEQIASWGAERIGIFESPTARVNGVDEPLSVDIAVFDTGLDDTHPDLRVAGGVDCAGAGTWRDGEGHGTLVGGVAAAVDNSIGIVGVAPGARLWSVRVEDERGRIVESSLLCGLDWVVAQGGIEVVNLSLGVKSTVAGPCGVKHPSKEKAKVKDPLHAAVCVTHANDVVIVAAAGNDAADAERQLPAAYPEVISVSAFVETDGRAGGLGPAPTCLPDEQDDHLASFSNFGATIDLSAPGVCVPSTLPGGRYTNVSGTSFAAPHVAAAAALVLVNDPELDPDAVRQKLIEQGTNDPLYGDPDGVTEPRLHLATL